MTKFTRRRLLGASAAILSVAACDQDGLGKPQKRITVSPDGRPGYPGAVKFAHGVASGDPLRDSVILWTRVTPDAPTDDKGIPVSYGVFEDADLTQPVAYSQGYAQPSRDYTVKVSVDGLKPGTEYFFRFEAKTLAGQIASPIGRTKTTAAAGDAPVRLAIASCANYPFGRFHVYRDIANMPDLDGVIHLGDYIYEYGTDGDGGDTGKAINRNHQPATETVTLDDYRLRHAQYKTDPDLQAAHAAAPWLCTWDDHETANDSHASGAQNHNPRAGEGAWSDRKQAAIQAYLEWMPIRDPQPGRARENIYRRFVFGDVATIICLDTRLTGRSDGLSWLDEFAGLDAAQMPLTATATMVTVTDERRTMLGAVQEDWLKGELSQSVTDGKTWQVLANQVVMARVRAPNFRQTLSAAQIAAQDIDEIKQLIEFSPLGLPWNLDAWDGFPAARDRLYVDAKASGANLITLSGDSHAAWANTLVDASGERRGVEFATTSITSPGFGTFIKDVDNIGDQFAAANPEVKWHDPAGNGWILLTLSKTEARGDYRKVTDVTAETFTVQQVASFTASRDGDGMTGLSRVK